MSVYTVLISGLDNEYVSRQNILKIFDITKDEVILWKLLKLPVVKLQVVATKEQVKQLKQEFGEYNVIG